METNKFENWTLYELIATASTIMSDLRGNWAYDYGSRMRILCDVLTEIIEYDFGGEKEEFLEQLKGLHPNYKALAKADLEVTQGELKEPYDGRVFRDSCHFYSVLPLEGTTPRVKEFLLGVLTHPEYTWVEEDESNE